MLGLLLIAIAVPGTPATLLDSQGIVVSEEDYPPDALIAGAEGVAAAQLTVDARGVPTGCRVTQSANNVSLDEATCVVLMRARFKPARNTSLQPVASVVLKRIRWQIENTDDPFADAMSTTRVVVDADGTLKDCTVSMTGVIASRLPVNFCPLLGDAERGAPALAKQLGRTIAGPAAVEVRVTFTTGAPHSVPGASPGEIIGSASFDVTPAGEVSNCVQSEGKALFDKRDKLCDLAKARLHFVEAGAARRACLILEIAETPIAAAHK